MARSSAARATRSAMALPSQQVNRGEREADDRRSEQEHVARDRRQDGRVLLLRLLLADHLHAMERRAALRSANLGLELLKGARSLFRNGHAALCVDANGVARDRRHDALASLVLDQVIRALIEVED